MSFTVRMITKGTSLKQHLVYAENLSKVAKKEMEKIAYKVKDKMISLIDENSKNSPSANGLRKTIDVHKTSNGCGIGKIAIMPSWWKIQNYGHGGYDIHAKNAKYLKFKGKNGEWVSKKSVFNKPCRAINYIERAVNYLENLLSNFSIKKGK